MRRITRVVWPSKRSAGPPTITVSERPAAGLNAPKRCASSCESTPSGTVLLSTAVSMQPVCTSAYRPKRYATPYLSASQRSAANTTTTSAGPIGTSPRTRDRMSEIGTPGPMVHGTTSRTARRIWNWRS
jgi:hypothetical protein